MSHLKSLYDATAEDLLFGIGTLMLEDGTHAPCIQVHYRSWTREMLGLVRDSFLDGIEFRVEQPCADRGDIVLATRQLMTIGAGMGGETHALRAPAWDARLESINLAMIRAFEFERHASGGFLLIVQAPEWEFLAGVMLHDGSCQAMTVQARFFPIPSTNS
jgi:hypothetical protein